MKSFFIGNKKISIPVIQGGMGVGVSLSGLASAVANEGGIGVISCAGLGLLYKDKTPGDYIKNSIEGLKIELRKARQKTKGVIGVNIMVALSNFSDMVRTAIAEKVDVIFSGAGLPLDLPSYLKKDSSTMLVPIVSSARAAKVICEKWLSNYGYLPDAIVVEGPKAGGHLGFKREDIDNNNYSLESIIPDVVAIANSYKQKDIPVIAAGGISTGEDINRFMELGARGVQLGSLFVPTYECDAALQFKQVYVNASKNDVMIIQSPVGMPGRAFDGEFIRSVNRGDQKPKGCPFHCIKTCDYTKSPYCIIRALYNAAKGNMDKGYAFAGANAYLTDKISSVKEVIAKLNTEFDLAQLKLKTSYSL